MAGPYAPYLEEIEPAFDTHFDQYESNISFSTLDDPIHIATVEKDPTQITNYELEIDIYVFEFPPDWLIAIKTHQDKLRYTWKTDSKQEIARVMKQICGDSSTHWVIP